MEFKTLVLWFCLLVTLTSASYNYMDCPGNTVVSWHPTRKCCHSYSLPKGCECFDISSKSDFRNSIYKSKCPDDINTKFLLYTRPNTNTPVYIKVGDTTIGNSPFDGSKPTKFITHGFTDFAPNVWSNDMKNALLGEEDANVILVDWKEGAKGSNYFRAVANTRTVGAIMARFIQELQTHHNAPYQSIHLIGHSLGAHASGIAGKEIHRLTSQLLGRISGLDPAGLSFEKYSPNVRLDKSDAAFVDVMHTNGDTVLKSSFGTRYSIGHVDFYPNGGKHQPACPDVVESIFSILDNIDNVKKVSGCSHVFCQKLFTNSIKKCRYDPPNGDASCTMGYHTSASCRGDYYPTTTTTPPYC